MCVGVAGLHTTKVPFVSALVRLVCGSGAASGTMAVGVGWSEAC